ncbi:MAG: hypothetical protein KGI29_07080 [Pseudomonadota bacterium]|nr:hypothetical protein [Pseudomonadota bacterium]MDE3037380.1 hypothetical protein [Pseudomonadota bacterium]
MKSGYHHSPAASMVAVPLRNFSELQARYEPLGLAARAGAILADAQTALEAARRIFKALEQHPAIPQAFMQLRDNHALHGRLRASEAKSLLLDGHDDFIEAARGRLSAWEKSMERLSRSEGIARRHSTEYIPGDAPLAIAIAGSANLSHYLGIVQLAIGELIKLDGKHTGQHLSTAAELRRCATVLSDCEDASGIRTVIH